MAMFEDPGNYLPRTSTNTTAITTHGIQERKIAFQHKPENYVQNSSTSPLRNMNAISLSWSQSLSGWMGWKQVSKHEGIESKYPIVT
jgi:hypothetical protein